MPPTAPASLLVLAALAASPSAQQPTTLPIAHRKPPLQVSATPIIGTDATLSPSPSIANLDAGDLVAGRTWWEYEPGSYYIETFLGFLWEPGTGMSVFEVPLGLYFSSLLTAPVDIARDRTVVGGVTNKLTLETRPFRWTPAGGFDLLQVPAGWYGGAVDVSDDGVWIAGSIHPSLFGAPIAARWQDGVLALLGPAGERSLVADGSADGSVLVGEVGPSPTSALATRWIDGVEAPLAPVPGASSSTALYVSDDGLSAIGRATVGGLEHLVRWAPDGTVTAVPPPAGLLIAEIRAINSGGTAAVGALTDSPISFASNWVPFLWRPSQGFVLLGELGLPDEYDYSVAVDVSDDGTRVVGLLSSWVFGPGSAPQLAFLWTESAGTLDLEVLQLAAGGAPLGLHNGVAISGDGNRILAIGAPGPLPEDSGAWILAFQGLP